MEFKSRLVQLRKEAGLTQEEFAQKIGFSRTAISAWEIGRNEPSNADTIKIANFFGVSTDYLLGKTDLKDNTVKIFADAVQAIEKEYSNKSNMLPLSEEIKKIPILGKISAGTPLYAEENLLGYDYVPASTINTNEEYFCLVVQGDSMNLKFKEGDRVLIKKQDTLENGEIGVILVNGDDATIKKYRFDNDMVILEPMSSNPDNHVQVYNPKEIKIKIVGKAIRYISDL